MTCRQAISLTPAQLLALNVYMEARGEPDDGKAAIARVTLNRTAQRYASDGTISGTVLGDNQFSWTQWDMVAGHYTKVAHTPEDEAARVETIFKEAQANTAIWAECSRIASAVQAGTYKGAFYALMTDDTVCYYNPEATEGTPAWAVPSKLVCRIGHHWFFRA